LETYANRFYKRRTVVALLFLYVLGFILNSSYLLPQIPQINFFDEVIYIESGKNLFLYHALWPFPRGPAISFFYAVIFPFIPESEFWLLTADLIGRVTAYTLLFISAWLIGTELAHRKLCHPLVPVALLTALPFYLILLPGPSYWTFVCFVSLTFWAVLNYARTQKLSMLLLAAIGSTLALMSRPDVVFSVSVLIAVMFITRPWRSSRMLVVVVLLAGIPTATVSSYIYAYGHQTGAYIFGGDHKLYDTFQASRQVLFDKKDIKGKLDFNLAKAARLASERDFGTAEENKYSVLRAIARNPSQFARIVWQNTIQYTAPSLMTAFGVRVPAVGLAKPENPLRYLSLFIFLFAAFGLAILVRRRKWSELIIVCLWPLDMGLYLFTISFPGYYLFHVMVVLMLVSIGLWACTSRLNDRRITLLLGAVLMIVVWLDWDHANRVVSLAKGGGILFVIAYWKYRKLENQQAIWAPLIIGGLALINPPTNYRMNLKVEDIGFFSQAKYLRDHYSPMSPVFAFPGVAPISANMWWIHTWADLGKVKSKEDFLAMMKLVGMPAIATDPMLKAHNIYGSGTMVEKYAHHYYRVVWRGPNDAYKILIPKDLSKSRLRLLAKPSEGGSK
jgi:hypothetical protein